MNEMNLRIPFGMMENEDKLKDQLHHYGNDAVVLRLDDHFKSSLLKKHYHSNFELFYKCYKRFIENLFNDGFSYPTIWSQNDSSYHLQNVHWIAENDPDFACSLMKLGLPLYYFGDKLMKNPSFVKKVMKTMEVNYLPYGSNDREFMKEIVTEAGYALQFGINSIQDDKEIVLLAIQQCPWAYLYASDRLKQDPQVMMEAARHGCICGASQEIASNRKIVLNAVKVSAFNLMYVSEELRNDKEIVNAALCNDPGCFDNIGSELLKNREFCKKMVLQCGYKATRVIDESLMSDSTFLKELVDLRLDDLFELRVGSIVDRKFSKELIRMCPWFIRTMMFSKDEELVMEAAKCDPKTVQYAHDSLRNNSEFAMKLVELDARTLLHLGPEVKQCFRVVMQAVKQNGLCLPYASSDLKNDPHIVRAACQQNPQAIQYAGSMLKGSQEFMLEMIQHNLSALQHASIHLKRNCLFLQQVKQIVLSHQELMRVKNPNIDFSSLDELKFAL